MVLVKRKRHASHLNEAGAPETVSGQEERLLCFGMIGRMADERRSLRRKQGSGEANSGECSREEAGGLGQGHIRRLDSMAMGSVSRSTSIGRCILSTENDE